MSALQALRDRQRRTGPRTIALAGVVWFGLAFQACAMPADDCPHCPPGMHDGAMTADSMDCDVVDSVDDPDLLTPASKLDDKSADLELCDLCGRLEPTAAACDHGSALSQKPWQLVHGPPLIVLICVYLK